MCCLDNEFYVFGLLHKSKTLMSLIKICFSKKNTHKYSKKLMRHFTSLVLFIKFEWRNTFPIYVSLFFNRKNTFINLYLFVLCFFVLSYLIVVSRDKHNYLFIRSADLDFDNLVTSISCDKTSNGNCLSTSFQLVVL